MILKRKSENIQSEDKINDDGNEPKKTNHKSVLAVIFFIVTIICVVFIISRHNEIKEKNKDIEYTSICEGYNTAVDNYNSSVERFNELIDKLKVYPIDELPDKLDTKDGITVEDINKDEDTSPSNVKKETEILTNAVSDINQKYDEVCIMSFNSIIEDYNAIATEYNSAVKLTSIDYITDMPTEVAYKEEYKDVSEIETDQITNLIDNVIKDTERIASQYIVIQQITNPSEEWIMERLHEVPSIIDQQQVSKGNDPNGLLNKEGGYTSCIYFTVKEIDQNTVKGKTVVEKGTDAGGAIEAYDTREHALNRCDYLSQFDGTLLYSGSYAVVGTMVIRTSYKLSDEQQIDLTDSIVTAFTRISDLNE